MSTALITGASSGLGLEFAKIYAKEGYDLVVVARSEGTLYKLKEELEEKYHHNVYVFVQDLSLNDAAYKIFNFTLENNIAVDILVNNAGFGDLETFGKLIRKKQTSLLNVNMVAVVQLTRYFLPRMVVIICMLENTPLASLRTVKNTNVFAILGTLLDMNISINKY